MKINYRGAVLFVVATLGLSACGGSDSGDSPAPDYLMMSVGNRWTYLVTSPDVGIFSTPPYNAQRVIAGPVTINGAPALIERRVLRQGMRIESSFVVTPSALLRVYEISDSPFLSPSGQSTRFRLPFKSGDSYVTSDNLNKDLGHDQDGDGINETFTMRAKVVVGSVETVQVPAGTFNNALRVTTQSSSSISFSSGAPALFENTTTDDWYAPGMGLIKQIHTQSASWGDTNETFVLTGSRINGVSTDTTPPTATQPEPAANSTVSSVTSIHLDFSEDMDPYSFNPERFTVLDENQLPVSGHLSGDTFWPDSPLPPGTYTVRVSNVTDALGNALATPYSWSFTVN